MSKRDMACDVTFGRCAWSGPRRGILKTCDFSDGWNRASRCCAAAWRGRWWVVETDVADCFSAIPHDRLMQAVEERVVDQPILKLLRAMLRAGVMEAGIVRHPVTGTPQGGVISPLLCNVYLHRLDRAWDTRAFGVLVRFADDLLVVCRSEQQAQAALERLRALLAELGLAPKEAKTRIVELAVGAEGFDFLGFHHKMVRSRGIRGRGGVAFLARWPSNRAMARARDRIRELTHRSRLLLPVEVIVADLNRFLRGWANYYRYGHSTTRFHHIEQQARDRLALLIGKRHKRGRGFGWSIMAYKSKNFCGPWSPSGTVITPGPNKPWREKPNAWR
jgi:group II intron reverse transcriptase/maturase